MYAIIEACGRQYKVQEGENVYFEKLGHVNTTQLKHENTLKEKIVNTVVQDAMKLIMEVTAVILFIGLLLTLTLKDEKINRKNKKSMSR